MYCTIAKRQDGSSGLLHGNMTKIAIFSDYFSTDLDQMFYQPIWRSILLERKDVLKAQAFAVGTSNVTNSMASALHAGGQPR